jgi:long-subunit acyl-CoA synthetase (AMP-forming)
VSAELAALLSEVNEKLEPHEQLAFAVVVSDPWTVESGLLTPTVKIRRDAIEKHYAPHVDGWFSQGEKVIWQASAGAPARASRTEPPRRIRTPPQP